MTAEHLLEAMGLLDDELIQEADALPLRKQPRRWQRWGSLAACAALIIALSCYGAAHLPMKGGSGSSAPSASCGAGESSDTAAGESLSSGIQDEQTSQAAGAPGGAADSSQPVEAGAVYLDGGVYALWDVVEELPEGCVQLGTLSACYPEGPAPSTDAEAYVGCQLWGSDGTDLLEVYVERPGGGYLRAVRAGS